jgi:hypothetical protein
MRSRVARWSVVLVLACSGAPAGLTARARAAVTQEQVERAVRDGVNFLRKAQRPDGSWDGPPGLTELVILALLTAGEPADEPTLARAIAFTQTRGPETNGFGTYAISLQTMALAAADPVAHREPVARNAAWLEQAQIREPGNPLRPRTWSGAWTYQMARGGTGDNSNSQYAVLGLSAAAEAGVPIADVVWAAARLYWEGSQLGDGGWSYKLGQHGSTASMTCAGVSSLAITGQRLFHGLETVRGGVVSRCGQGGPDIPLLRGTNWLGSHFRVTENFGGQAQWKLYYLYGLERAGRLAGVRYFGAHDWYREGAEELVRTQDRLSGSWQGSGGPLPSTSFAVLFLAKGRAPVLVHKLRHGAGNDWENDRDDVRNLTALVSRDWKKLLTWQVADIETASVEDLLQAPIVFFNGHESPRLSPEARRRLRDYVDQGGFLFADACCGRVEFDRGFRALMRAIFPEPGYELHRLDDGHPVWRSRHVLSPRVHPLWGIEFGCRTVVIYSPDDLSCFWNQMDSAVGEPAVEAASRVGQNVVDYATGRELPADKLAPREVVRDRLEPPKRGALQIAKLKHAGDWNVAPMAVPHLTQALRDRSGLDVVINHRELLPSDPNLVNFPLIYVHGRSGFVLGDDDLARLRRHLAPGGGTIFADAACGSPAFDAAFRRLVAQMLPDRPIEPIPRDDDLFTRKVGFDLSDVRFSKAAGGGQGYPELEGVKVDGHWAVIYSKYDIGCALERPQAVECKGYAHESAVRIAANIVLYSTMP